MPSQHSHNSTPFSTKKQPIVLVCDGVRSPSNIGSLFRICDAFGVSNIIFCDAEINIRSSRLQKTARSTQKKVAYSVSEDILSEIEQLKNDGYTIVALEITDKSTSIEALSAEKNQKTALVIGNEQSGVSETVLEKSSQTAHITMFGENSSMNVVQATSIALYEISRKLNN